jgi:hypothetical protein
MTGKRESTKRQTTSVTVSIQIVRGGRVDEHEADEKQGRQSVNEAKGLQRGS